jgi:hypothetical protein
MATATSFAVPNYSGMLFVKGNARTPFSTLIGANPLVTNHVEFTCGQFWQAKTGTQPEISETASLTAPQATVTTRTQVTNVTQIFQYSVDVSYGKMANMGTLSGINVANQAANPQSELDFQVAATMAQAAADIEYTFLNGAYSKAATDAQANKTRGLIAAITSNVVDADSAALSWDMVTECLAKIHKQGGVINNYVLGVDSTAMIQLNKAAIDNKMTIVPASREVNGLALSTIVTPLGNVALVLLDTLPAGTAVVFNPAMMHPVYQPVPGKGNFFLEPLAKVGASEKYQIYGELGLDHGQEYLSGKITGILTA